MFINACFAATNQNDYYTDRYQQSITIDFLHQYVMANFRRLYGRVLAAGINHFNQGLILFNLLKSGAPKSTEERVEEGQLIFKTLQQLPANRVYRLFRQLQKRRVNNRRTRAVIKRYLAWRPQPTFDAIKYRSKFRAAITHAHVDIDEQLGGFLFEFGKLRKIPRRSVGSVSSRLVQRNRRVPTAFHGCGIAGGQTQDPS